MRWLGRYLAYREHDFLHQLRDVEGIPKVYRSVIASGKIESNAVAHDFVAGNPLSLCNKVPLGFFDRVEALLAVLHGKRIAYVDLHKQENVLVGDDGLPYLIDFQVSIQCSRGILGGVLMRMLKDLDLFNVAKHRRIHGQTSLSSRERKLPWWLNIHRAIAVPFRTLRRNLLVLLRVRAGHGSSCTEVAPEIGLRRADAV
jgi:RIO-like serine/threonine protein kinase